MIKKGEKYWFVAPYSCGEAEDNHKISQVKLNCVGTSNPLISPLLNFLEMSEKVIWSSQLTVCVL